MHCLCLRKFGTTCRKVDLRVTLRYRLSFSKFKQNTLWSFECLLVAYNRVIKPKNTHPIHRFIKYHQDCNQTVTNQFMFIFHDVHRTPLKYVSIRESTITDDGLKVLLRHNLASLSLWYCDNVTTESWNTLIEHGGNLRELELGRSVDMLKHSALIAKEFEFQLMLPNLRRLKINTITLLANLQFR